MGVGGSSWLDHLGNIWAVIFGDRSHLRVIRDSFGGHREVIGMSSGSHRGVIGGSSAGYWESWRDRWGVLCWSSGGHMRARLASSGGHRGVIEVIWGCMFWRSRAGSPGYYVWGSTIDLVR